MSPNHLDELARRYAGLEMRVQRLMQAFCAPSCSACTVVCCQPVMCRESLESPFLSLVRGQGKTRAAWRQEKGWLGAQGCRLTAGRPPVCYEFLCQAIMARQINQAARTSLISLAKLLSQAGRRALGGDHLVEIMSPQRLTQIKPQRLHARLDKAEAELNAIEKHWPAPWARSASKPLDRV